MAYKQEDFKVGDEVTIRSWDSMVEEFGLDEDRDIKIYTDTYFFKSMKNLCSTTFIIKDIYASNKISYKGADTVSYKGTDIVKQMCEPSKPKVDLYLEELKKQTKLLEELQSIFKGKVL